MGPAWEGEGRSEEAAEPSCLLSQALAERSGRGREHVCVYREERVSESVTVRPRCGPHCQIVQLAWPQGGGSGALMLRDSQGPLAEEGNPHSLLSTASWGMESENPKGDLGISVPTLPKKVPLYPNPQPHYPLCQVG